MVFIKLLIFLGLFIAISTFLVYGTMNVERGKIKRENVWVTLFKKKMAEVSKFLKDKKWKKPKKKD